MACANAIDVADVIISDVLFGRLDLSELGFTRSQISEETPLFAAEGLGLDSVEALEIAVAVQQIFGFRIENLDRTFFEQHCATVGTLADYVRGRMSQP